MAMYQSSDMTPDVVSASTYDVRFPLARSMIVSGPSCSGKSHFVTQLLQQAKFHFHPSPKRIFWYFGEIAPKPPIPHVCYRRGLPSEQEIEAFHQSVVVLDDLMWESRSSVNVGNLFTRVAHHRQCFIIHITQNLFQGGSITRTQSLNAHYLVLFKNPRIGCKSPTWQGKCIQGMQIFYLHVLKMQQ